MDSNQNKFNPFDDCQGTCKTPIGCTCAKANKEAIEKAISNKDKDNKEVKKSCCCQSTDEESASTAKKSCCKKTNSCCGGTHKLEVYDWLGDIPEPALESQMVEVQFKNTRKGYYLNSNNIELYKGDIVAVEATPGHDIGEVTLTGKLVPLQMRKNNYRGEVKRIYRIAKSSDIEKQEEAKAKEHKTMLRAREIAEELNLAMKISDVEYQGDGNKAIFYYIADERVDFRQLIKVYASEFRVKIEMKQIGARQEAGRVGGIGPCGRELCCSSSMSNFISVSTSAARIQDIPLNPQKLAGQCGKLKCCLNFEVDTYVEAQKKLPSREVPLETKDATYFHFKTDILSGAMTYSTDKNFAANLITIDKERVYEILRINRRGDRPLHLNTEEVEDSNKAVSHDLLAQDNINRFDGNNNGKNNKKKKFSKNRPQENNNKPVESKPENGKSNNTKKTINKPTNGRPDNNNQGNNNKQENKPENNKPENNKQESNKPANPNKKNRRNNRNRPQRNDRNNNPKTED